MVVHEQGKSGPSAIAVVGRATVKDQRSGVRISTTPCSSSPRLAVTPGATSLRSWARRADTSRRWRSETYRNSGRLRLTARPTGSTRSSSGAERAHPLVRGVRDARRLPLAQLAAAARCSGLSACPTSRASSSASTERSRASASEALSASDALLRYLATTSSGVIGFSGAPR